MISIKFAVSLLIASPRVNAAKCPERKRILRIDVIDEDWFSKIHILRHVYS